MAAPEPVGDPLRWLVLLIMFCVGLLQCTAWMTFNGNPEIAETYYGLAHPQATLDLLLNWGPILYLATAPIVALGTTRQRDGVWVMVLVGALLTVTGLLLRLVPSVPVFGVHPTSWAAFWCICGGQALNGAAGPMNCLTPSIVAAVWFLPGERTFATSAVFAAQMAGPSIGFLFALNVRHSEDLILLMKVEAVAAIVVAIAWALLPRRPRRAPSMSQRLRVEAGHEPVRDLNWSCAGGAGPVATTTTAAPATAPPARRLLSAWLLFVSGGLTIGFFQVWSSSLPTQLNGILPGPLVKSFAIIMGIASLVGNYAAGPLTEKLGLQNNICWTVGVALCLQVLGSLGFGMLLPGAPLSLGVAGSDHVLMALLVLTSIAEGIMSPLIFELGAELTYPYSESFSGAIFSWLLNAFGLILLVVFPLVPDSWDPFAMVGALLVSLILLRGVREEHPRRRLDEPGLCLDE